ncbi:MAG: DinB family protein [Acidimicrobiales bacterium]
MEDRPPPHLLADEKNTLVSFLDYVRESFVGKLDGLDEAACHRELVASGTNLYWLVTHLTEAEITWFQRVFAGSDPEPPPMQAKDTTALAIGRYRDVCARSREIVRACLDLEQPSARADRRGVTPTMRWVLVHMIEETARHAGHADILREQLDGSTGR